MPGTELLTRGHAAWRASDFAMALALAEEARVALVRGDVAPEHADWGRHQCLRALALRDLGRLDDARTAGERAVNAAREWGWSTLLPVATLALGRVHVGLGDSAAAEPLLAAARAAFEARGESARVADCAVEEAVLALREGRVADCEAHVAEAARRYTECKDPNSAGIALLVAADARRGVGDLSGAAEVLEDAAARLATAQGAALLILRCSQARQVVDEGDRAAAVRLATDALTRVEGDVSRSLRARLWNLMGDAHHTDQQPERALRAWARSAELYDEAGDQDRAVPVSRQAMGLISQRRYGDARPLIAGLLLRLEGQRRVDLQATLHALMLPCVVAAHDWGAWAHHYGRAVALTEGSRLAELGAADAARRAGELGARAAWTGPGVELLAAAVRSNALALELYRRLGRSDDAQAANRALRDLGRRGAPVPAGPFDLDEILGRGAMGEVWRARHHARREQVAIKVVGRTRVAGPRFRELIESEIRAMVTLDHPNIARVVDHGVLGPEAEAVGRDGLQSGSPWFAMELATAGSLEPLCGQVEWSTCRQILLVLLDALAHAHARGVFHLDLKPSNVLIREAEDGSQTVLLTDFGLAHMGARTGREAEVAGTPEFMAPEQFGGDHRDYGPWTDLYGLGCLATHLVTGKPPFDGDGFEAQRQAHVEAPLPSPSTAADVPAGLAEWITVLLAKRPGDRFLQAADAAWALRRLDEASLPKTPTMSDGWEVHRPPSGPGHVEAAPQLFRVRRPQVVGRHAERDVLWGALQMVTAEGRPGIVVLHGSQGVGKAALSRWVAERAHEAGVATVLDGAADGSVGGLAAAVTRRLRLAGSTVEEALARIGQHHHQLTPEAIGSLARLAAGSEAETPSETRVSAVAALAVQLAEPRPLVVRLELGNPVDLDVAGLADALVQTSSAILVVLEANDLVGLEPLLASDRAEVLQVEPLPDAVLRQLVTAMVPLEPPLLRRIVEQSAGHPNHAVQLVADLVERHALTVVGGSWSLRPGGRIRMPRRLGDRYTDRVQLVQRALARPARVAVAAAALLGMRVPGPRWHTIAEACGLVDPEPIFRRMRTASLGVRDGEGWRFAHPAVRELVRSRWPTREAFVVAAEVAGAEGTAAGVLGWLWAEAGELVPAIPLLLQGARLALARGDGERALELVDRRASALRTLGTADDASEWTGDALIRAELASRGARRSGGLQEAERAVSLAVTHGQDALLAAALAARGQARRALGQPTEARECYEEAMVAFDALRDGRGVARSLCELGDLARSEGDLAEADRLYDRALTRLHAEAGGPEQLRVRAAVAKVRLDADDLGVAEAALLEVLQASEDLGDPGLAVECLDALGNVARFRGEPRLARARYAKALERVPTWWAQRSDGVRVHQAMAMVAEGRDADAARCVDEVLAGAESDDRGPVIVWCRLLQLVGLAAAAEPTRWSRQVGLVERLVVEARLWERDAGCLLERAGQRAQAAGHANRAVQAWRLAETVYRSGGRSVAADAVAQRLSTFSSLGTTPARTS